MRLNQPDTAADPALFRKLMREYHDTEPVVKAYRDWQTALDHLAQAKALLEEPGSLDPDFKQIIQQEISEKSQDVAKDVYKRHTLHCRRPCSSWGAGSAKAAMRWCMAAAKAA